MRRRALRSRSVQPSHSGPHPICPFPQLGSTAVGIQVPDGVLLAVEKRITSPLLEPESIEKIMEVDSHLGCSMSGLTADARTLIDHARIETQNHRFTYDTPMTVEATTQSICDLALGFGEGGEKSMVRQPPPFPPSSPPVPRACVLLLWGHLGRAYAQRFVAREQSRPYGVALLLAGVDDKDGPVLYHTDPSGTFVRFKAGGFAWGMEIPLRNTVHSVDHPRVVSKKIINAISVVLNRSVDWILSQPVDREEMIFDLQTRTFSSRSHWNKHESVRLQNVGSRFQSIKQAPEYITLYSLADSARRLVHDHGIECNKQMEALRGTRCHIQLAPTT